MTRLKNTYDHRSPIPQLSFSPSAIFQPSPAGMPRLPLPGRRQIEAVLLCVMWYTSSMLHNVLGKSVLKVFPNPMTMTLCQLVVINMLIPFFQKRRTKLTRRDFTTWVIPLAALKLLASISGHVSILKVPVSYAHTVKALTPIFVVILSRMVLKQHHSPLAYVALLPIIGGVTIASATELQFNLVGMLSALLASGTFAVQSIYSKKVMKGGLDHLTILQVVSWYSMIGLLPLWLFREGTGIFFNTLELDTSQAWTVLIKLAGNATFNSLQTIAAFTFLSRVTPVTYSVASVAKRVFIIVASMIVFRNPVTPANVTGIAITLVGIGLYNKAKLSEKRRELRSQIRKSMQV